MNPPEATAWRTTPNISHVAIIMDGNGRWAEQRKLDVVEGHAAGEAAILAACEAALRHGVSWLTLYAFSTENWSRSPAEVAFLMQFNAQLVMTQLTFFVNNGIRVVYNGDLEDGRIPEFVRTAIVEVQEATSSGCKLNLCLAFNYGGRWEMRQLAARVRSEPTAAISDDQEMRSLLPVPDMPDVDLLIRTSGEQRLSNFLPWHSAYAELHFTDVFWPDFRETDFAQAVAAYARRRRRFGGR